MRDEREDVELHQSANPSATTMRRAVEIDTEDAVLDHRQQHTVADLQDVVGDTREHVRHGSERAAVLLHDLEPEQLERVVLVVLGRRQLGTLHFQLRPPRAPSGRA